MDVRSHKRPQQQKNKKERVRKVLIKEDPETQIPRGRSLKKSKKTLGDNEARSDFIEKTEGILMPRFDAAQRVVVLEVCINNIYIKKQ